MQKASFLLIIFVLFLSGCATTPDSSIHVGGQASGDNEHTGGGFGIGSVNKF